LAAPAADRLVADTEVGSDLGYKATCSYRVEHLAAELFGITLGHGHRSFDECRDQKVEQTDSIQPRAHQVKVYGMSALGTVRVWHCEEGWGVIDSLDTPGGCWADISHLWCVGTPEPGPGEVVRVSSEFLEAFEGEIIDFQWERANQGGYDFRATTVRVRERQPPHRLIRHYKADEGPHFQTRIPPV
jgi:CspA family cold shock protein